MPTNNLIVAVRTVNLYLQLINEVIISGSTVLVRTLAASHRKFRILFKTLGRTPLDKSDQPVAKVCTYIGLHSTETQNIHAWSRIRTRDFNKQAAKTFALDRAATGTGLTKEMVA
jgi:hypothetical protein